MHQMLSEHQGLNAKLLTQVSFVDQSRLYGQSLRCIFLFNDSGHKLICNRIKNESNGCVALDCSDWVQRTEMLDD